MRNHRLIILELLQTAPTSIYKNIDFIISLLGIILSPIGIIYLLINGQKVVSWSYSYMLYVIALLFVFIFSFYWFFKKSKRNIEIPINETSRHFIIQLAILFFILVIITDAIYFYRANIYQRPLLFFILISILFGIVAIEIIYSRKIQQILIIFQIIFLGLILVWSQSSIFPTISGVDPWYHQNIVLKILDGSHIPNGLAYSSIPMFHLFVSITAIISNTDFKIASILSVGNIQIICFALFIFIFSISALKNFKIGLMATLLVTIADRLIALSYKPIPNSYALVILLALIYILYISKKRFYICHYILFFILIIAINLSHILVSIFLIIVIGYLFIMNVLFFKDKCISQNPVYSIWIPTVCVVLMLSWWSYVSGSINNLADLLSCGFSVNSQIVIPTDLLRHYDIPPNEQLFNSLGMLIYLVLSLIGVFYLLSIKNSRSIFIVMLGLLPLIIGAGSALVGHSVLWYRWYYIAEIFLSIPLAISIIYIHNINNLKMKYFKIASVFIIIFLITTISIFNPSYNDDYPLFSQHSAIRYSLIDSEVKSAVFISNNTDEIYTDSDFRHTFSLYFSYLNPNLSSFKALDSSFLSGQYDYKNSVLIIRTYITEKPFRLQGATYELNHDPNTIIRQSSNEIYSNEAVNIYY